MPAIVWLKAVIIRSVSDNQAERTLTMPEGSKKLITKHYKTGLSLHPGGLGKPGKEPSSLLYDPNATVSKIY